jgi:hypothetical protein
LFRDVFAFAFFTRVTIDYNASSSSDFPGFYLANNEGAIFEQCDVLGPAVAASSNRGFFFENGTSVWLDRTMADNCGAEGYRINNVWYIQVNSTRSSGCFDHGFHTLGGCRYIQGFVQVVGRRAQSSPPASKDGVRIAGASQNISLDVFSFSNTGHGIFVTGASTRCSLGKVEVLSCTLDGVRLDGATYSVIASSVVQDVAGDGIHVTGGSYSCALLGGVVRAAGGHGVRISSDNNSGIAVGAFSITGCTGRAIHESGTGNSALFSGCYALSNTAGNYDIAGGFVHINGMGLNSGAYLATATGAATG